jgi:hypothetical protein
MSPLADVIYDILPRHTAMNYSRITYAYDPSGFFRPLAGTARDYLVATD